MTTSWASSTDDNNHERISSSSTDHGKSINKQNHSSSEGSIFSDSDIQQEEESHKSPPLVNFERGPSFLMPNV